jgi:hypothetical protein
VVSQLNFNGIVIIAGNYGSGKTEVAINLSVHQQCNGLQVSVADLDLVNPYFRTREARKVLADMGVQMVLPPDELLQADLPVLAPQVIGLIKNPGDLAILDVGGDNVGATVLAALADGFRESHSPVTMLQVVNPFRPSTESLDGCLKMRASIEKAAGIAVNGWIGNAHMLTETTPARIEEGYRFMVALARESGIPLIFITAAARLVHRVAEIVSDCPVLPVFRQLVSPWENPEPFDQDACDEGVQWV